MLWQFGPPMSTALGLQEQDIIKTVSIIICIEPTGLGIGKTDPWCGTVQFCFRSGPLTCSARTGLRAATTPLYSFTTTFLSCGISLYNK